MKFGKGKEKGKGNRSFMGKRSRKDAKEAF